MGRLLNNSPMKSRQNLGHPLPPLDSESEEISSLVLKCLAHLFSWIPLSSTITPSLVSTVFYLAEFGCRACLSTGVKFFISLKTLHNWSSHMLALPSAHHEPILLSLAISLFHYHYLHRCHYQYLYYYFYPSWYYYYHYYCYCCFYYYCCYQLYLPYS